MAELRTIPVSWALDGTPFRQRYPYGGGALCVWRLQPELAGRTSLQFSDNPQAPGSSDASFPVREGDVFTHSAKYVWVTVAAPPSVSGVRYQTEGPFMLLVVAPTPCDLPTRTAHRGGGVTPFRAQGTAAGPTAAILLGLSVEVWHVSASFFSTGGAPYLSVWLDDHLGGTNELVHLIVQPNQTEQFDPARPFMLSSADVALGPVAVYTRIVGGTGTWIVNVGWRPSEGVLYS